MPICHHQMVEMTLRFEIFPDDLDTTVDFYMRVLRFRLTADRRDQPGEYVSLQRGSVRVGATRRAVRDVRAARLPPAGVELVLEVDDVVAERDRGHGGGMVAGGGSPGPAMGPEGLPDPRSGRVLLADYGPGPLIAYAGSDQPGPVIFAAEARCGGAAGSPYVLHQATGYASGSTPPSVDFWPIAL
jgi:predicted enzyme related to lactoylglutathione lyase